MSEVFLQMCVLPFPYVPGVCPVSLVYAAMPKYMQLNLCLGGSAISVNLRPQVAESGFWGFLQAMNEAV